MWRTIALLFFCSMPVRSALAEGGTCPPGYHPVNSPGVMGCAPMPGGSDQPIDTGPSWMTTWGAIAADGEKQIVAASFSQGSKRKAESTAIKQCRAKGGSKKCKTWVSFYNQCAALAAGDSQAVAFRAGTIEEASRGAMKDCSALTPSCKIVQTVCSYPVRVN